MEFHILGERSNPLIILIHGMMTPWQILQPAADYFCDKYCVLIPELDGHTQGRESTFNSIEEEAEEIEDYVLKNFSEDVFAVCGLSMGGVISYKLLLRNKLRITNLIMDGAPLVGYGKIMSSVMTNQYISIAEKSRKRHKKTLENFSKNFLPEKHLNNFLSFIDYTTDESIRNIISSLNASRLSPILPAENTKILYIHGTAVNEMLSKKTAKLITKLYPQAIVINFKGDSHCQCAIYEPLDWAKVAEDFFYR